MTPQCLRTTLARGRSARVRGDGAAACEGRQQRRRRICSPFAALRLGRCGLSHAQTARDAAQPDQQKRWAMDFCRSHFRTDDEVFAPCPAPFVSLSSPRVLCSGKVPHVNVLDARPPMCTCACAGNVLHGENPRGRRIRHAGIPGACACAGFGGCVPPRESASASVLALHETGLRQTVRLVTARLSVWHLLAARLSARHLCCATPRHTARMPLCVCAHASLPVNVRACVRDKRSPWQSKARRGPMV